MTERTTTLAGLACAFLLGLALRLYLLSGQILLDDEWHGLIFLQDRTFFEVLTQINPFQNSSPLLNLYGLLCYRTIGVSEWNLRLPLLIAGSVLVVLVPFLLRNAVSRRAAIIYAFLLAISPFLIFYSRFSRAYILTTLLVMTGLTAAFRWFGRGRPKDAVVFIACSVLAVYSHVSALAVALAPYGAYLLALLTKRLRRTVVVPVRGMAGFATAHAVLLFIVMFNFIKERGKLPLNVMTFKGSDLRNILGLITGSGYAGVVAFVLIAAALGCYLLFKRQTLLALLLCAGIVFDVGFILVLNPLGIESSAVFTRYCIAVIPIVLCFAAVGLDEGLTLLLRRIPSPQARRWLAPATIGGMTAALVAAGPLPVIYRSPNNFTNHLAYQGNYAYGDWQRSRSNHYFPSFEITADQMPAFYTQLAADGSAHVIIDYPFDFADHSDLDYFYQRRHGKRVLAGYCSEAARVRLTTDAAMGERIQTESLTLAYTRPEFFVSDAQVKSHTHFRNMVDVCDDADLRGSDAAYIVLHKVIQSIYLANGKAGNFELYDLSVPDLADHYRHVLGTPVFEDAQIVVFPISAAQ